MPQLRAIRKNAKQGDLFTPQIADLFKRLLRPEVKQAPRDTKQALVEQDGDIAQVWLKVNARYPIETDPLATVPANLLANLPQLPPDVE